MIQRDTHIECDKCTGKVFVDLTFTDNKDYETYCLKCGKRWFVGIGDEFYSQIREYVEKALVG